MKKIFYATTILIFILKLTTLSFATNFQVNNKLTVSGISSGAFFAHQFHLTYNKEVIGAALFAGGPFYCARNSINRALDTCMKGEGSHSLALDSLSKLKDLEKEELIDHLDNIKNDRVFLFSGLNDNVVDSSVVYQVKKLYLLLGLKEEDITFKDSALTGHAWPTLNFGNPCETPKESPFISDCDYDGALESYRFLYPNKEISTINGGGDLIEIDQTSFFSERIDSILMQEKGYLYIPKSCYEKRCDFHIAFHGCAQTLDHIQEQFIKNTGIIEASKKLSLVILFPQAKKSYLPSMNPYGCWDWWGHSNSDYYHKKGNQMNIVKKMAEYYMGRSIDLEK